MEDLEALRAVLATCFSALDWAARKSRLAWEEEIGRASGSGRALILRITAKVESVKVPSPEPD